MRPGLLLLLALSGCEVVDELQRRPDAGLVTVPGTFHAARTTPGHKAHLALKGEQRVACRDCHAIADAGFTSPSVAICANCHQSQQAQHHPFPLDAGVEVSCLTCHVFNSKDVGVRFEKWSCLTCHREAQGTKAAITVHVENCSSCHRPHEKPFTEAGDCSTCHALTVTHGDKGPTLQDTCMSCHPPHTAAAPASRICLDCHTTTKVGVAARVAPEALWKDGHAGCGACHPTHAFDRAHVKSCGACHEKKQVVAADEHARCTSCHQPHENHARPKPCESCHARVAKTNTHPKTEGGVSCTGCHPVHPTAPDAPTTLACVSCHDKPTFTADVVHAPTTTCEACHAPHTGKPPREPLCKSCHEHQVNLVKRNTGHAKCDDCHAGLPHAERSEPKPCLTCHEKMKPPQQGHGECASCHESHEGKVFTTCAGCHLTPKSKPLPGLHTVAKHQDCKSCHAPHEPQPGFGPKACATCHGRPSMKNHPTPPTQCVGCHLFSSRAP